MPASACVNYTVETDESVNTVGFGDPEDDWLACGGGYTSTQVSAPRVLGYSCVRDHNDAHPYTCSASTLDIVNGYCQTSWHGVNADRDWTDQGEVITARSCVP